MGARITGLNELREAYLEFFEDKGHLRMPSFPLVPENDPSILLINAGMTPFKPYFTGEAKPPSLMMTTCQKCLRTVDIERVGVTERHASFFEMLGNFSFAAYFKREAIQWAWEFVIEVIGMEKDKVWVTVYLDDDEAQQIWEETGMPAERIVRLGKKDNFWEHGTGPCGPSSEIYLDRGERKGCGSADCRPGCDCDRFVEFWNLVFTQYNKDEKGEYTLLDKKNIDTGMGLERIACLMQEVDSIFDVDTIANIIKHVGTMPGVAVPYGNGAKTDSSYRIVTDHIRGCVMLAADGVLPSNEGRGYIFRRLLRRAARHGKLLGIKDEFLHKLADIVIRESGRAYPEIIAKKDHIRRILLTEEERFYRTIDSGLGILNDCMASVKGRGGLILPGSDRLIPGSSGLILPGSDVFKLHDTFGFPLELTREIAAENGYEVDEAGFAAEMEMQRKRAREALKAKDVSAWGGRDMPVIPAGTPKTEFIGYECLAGRAKVLAVISATAKAGNNGNNSKSDKSSKSCIEGVDAMIGGAEAMEDTEAIECCVEAMEGAEAVVILDRTPFYAESGGQVADTGYIESSAGRMRVDGCRKTADDVYYHTGIVETGSIRAGDDVDAVVDEKRRRAIASNHSVTHLLHKAMREVLGGHVAQSGSFVGPDRLRFDFAHMSPVTPEQLDKIERIVNDKIFAGLPVDVVEMSPADARKTGAVALFGEKYAQQQTLRVVSIGDYSKELCGGTHLRSTSEASMVKIVSESGIAAGVRRIEALTGESAFDYLNARNKLVHEAAGLLKAAPDEITGRIEALSNEIRDMHKEMTMLREGIVAQSLDKVLQDAVDVSGIRFVRARYDRLDPESLRNTADRLKEKIGSGVVLLASAIYGKVSLIAVVTADLVSRGINAGALVKEVAAITGGGGGGRPDMAQAGGKNPEKIDEALKYASEALSIQVARMTGKRG